VEELNGKMLSLAIVEEDAALLGGGEAHRHVGCWPRVERLKFHKAGMLMEVRYSQRFPE
jgi:hypothetical protein